MRGTRIVSFVALVAIAVVIAPQPADALTSSQQSCVTGVAHAGYTFLKKKLKKVQTCKNKPLSLPSGCPNPDCGALVQPIEDRFSDTIDRSCGGLTSADLIAIGYAQICTGGTAAFTVADLKTCMITKHEAVADALIDAEYGGVSCPLSRSALRCQRAIAKFAALAATSKMKKLQRCFAGIPGGYASGDPIPQPCLDAAAQAMDDALAKIAGRCTDADVASLDVCDPPAETVPEARMCLGATHEDGADSLLRLEYPPQPRPWPWPCGNGVKAPDEECDGSDDANCPGACGAADGCFACLCQTPPPGASWVARECMVEHAEADLDNGWSGQSHDSLIVEGGGYVVNLYDCDGPGGPDTVCTVGPSCSGVPHSPCTTDTQCASVGQGMCRLDGTRQAPHCILDPARPCASDGDCPGTGNFCKRTLHGAPLPLTGGGVSVCVVNEFSEDVVGTRDLADGSAVGRIRQKSIVSNPGLCTQPCPVCGGFCQAPPMGDRRNCTQGSDCPSGVCVLAPVCSAGANVDKPCRPDPPFGGPTQLFGNSSVDCPLESVTPAGVLDILFDPVTTGTVTRKPSIQCDYPAFANKRCDGGANYGAVCTDNSQCPGGECRHQCFCPGGGGVKQQPNSCDSACLRGANDGLPCTIDGDCPGGICHPADCRPDQFAPAELQPHEGACTVTSYGHCSISACHTCFSDAHCRPPECPDCGVSETCNVGPKNCFINSGITRVGVPDPVDPVAVAIFCIAATNSGAVNSAAGLPGPGALRQPTTVIRVGF